MTPPPTVSPADGHDGRADFDAFYAATAPRLVAALYALTGDRSDAEDAVQEAFARAWQRWPTVSAQGDPTPWVRTVARRLAVSTWRKARNRLLAQFRHGPPPEVPAVAPDHVALVEALRELPPQQRTAVVLHHLMDLPVAEVARETGASQGAVRTRLHRGRRALAELLAEDDRAPRPAAPTPPAGASEPSEPSEESRTGRRSVPHDGSRSHRSQAPRTRP